MRKLKLREAHGTLADNSDGYNVVFYQGLAPTLE
jgi:hypothetical protein